MLRALTTGAAGLALSFLSANAFAAFGATDTSFGDAGLVTIDSTADDTDQITSLAVDANDRIYALVRAGASFSVLRFTADGDLDTTFDTDGILPLASTGYHMTALAIDSQGRFLVGTAFEGVLLYRYTAAGEFDNTFDTDGLAAFPTSASDYIASVRQIQVRADGKILVGATRKSASFGNLCYFPLRFTDAGAADTTFDGDGGSYACGSSYAFHELNTLAAGPNNVTLSAGFGSTPGNRQATYALADNSGTHTVVARSVGYGDANSYPEASAVALRYVNGKVSLLAQSLSGGKPANLMAISGSGVTPDSGTVFDNVSDMALAAVTLPAGWVGTGTYALQSDGSVLLGGRVDAGSGNYNAALIRFEGAPQLAVPTSAGGGGDEEGGGGGGGALPLSLAWLLGLAALVRARRRAQ